MDKGASTTDGGRWTEKSAVAEEVAAAAVADKVAAVALEAATW